MVTKGLAKFINKNLVAVFFYVTNILQQLKCGQIHVPKDSSWTIKSS